MNAASPELRIRLGEDDPSGGRLADFLTHSDPRARMMGRAVASGWPDGLLVWVRSEAARGADTSELLLVLSLLCVQQIGSVAAALVAPSGDAILTGLVKALVEEKLPGHIAATRADTAARGSAK